MKNLNPHFFILILLISCSIAVIIKNKHSKTLLEIKQQPDVHNIIIFGNIGEIEYIKNSTSFSENLETKEKEDYYEKNIFTQKYFTKKLSCVVTDKETNSTINLLNEKGLTNFEKVLYDKDVLGFVQISDEILFLGYVANPEYRNLTFEKTGKQTSDYLSFFESRIKCGWNIFLNTLKKVSLATVITNEDKENIFVSDKIKFNIGKSINRDLEDVIMGNLGTFIDEKSKYEGKKKAEGFIDSEKTSLMNTTSSGFSKFALGKTPIIITIVYQDFTLQIIDFDSNILSCLAADNEAEYNLCSKTRSFSNLTYQESFKYALKLDNILNKKVIKSTDQKKVWKVMRAFHSPILSGRKSNLFYYKNITAINSNGEPITFNLWESIKSNLINIFFSASDNNASVNVIPYSVTNFENTKFNCFKNTYEDIGCYYRLKDAADDQIDYSKVPMTKKVCDNDLFYKLPYKSNTNKTEESFMYVFNVGNSGSNLEKIDFGYTANAYLFWARAQKDFESKQFIHGFAYLSITKDYFEVNFMETEVKYEDKKTKSYRAATFRITESPIPQQSKLIQYIKNSICKDFLVIGRSGTI